MLHNRITALMFATGLCLLKATTGHATTHLRLTPAEIAQNADLIVTGEIVSRECRWNDSHTMIFTDVHIRADVPVYATSVARSKAGGELVLSFAGGTINDTSAVIADMPQLLPGKRYLLFTRDDGRPYLDPLIGGAQGCFELVRDEVSGREYVLTASRRPVISLAATELKQGALALEGMSSGTPRLRVSSAFSALPAEVAPGVPADPESRSEAIPVTTTSSELSTSPLSVEEFVRIVREDLLVADVSRGAFRRNGTVGATSSFAGIVRGAASSGGFEETSTTLPDVPLFEPSAAIAPAPLRTTTPASATAVEGGSVGYCGFQSLNLNLQQVPTSFWSYVYDQFAMNAFNLHMDIFRSVASDGSYTSGGTNEICGWVDEADLVRVYGFHWNGALAMTVTWWGCECCRITQSDVMFNPAYSWTANLSAALGTSTICYLPAMIHELGHTVGFQMGSRLPETYDYDIPTIMQGYYSGSVWEDGRGLHWLDAWMLRQNYDDQRTVPAVADLGVETYRASNGLIAATLSTSSGLPGSSVTLSGVTVENMSNSEQSDVRLRFYLAPSRSMATTTHQIGSYWYWSSFPRENRSTGNYTAAIPWNTPGGTYYVGAQVTRNGYAGDQYSPNDVSWFTTRFTVLNPVPVAASASTLNLSVGYATTLTITGSGFVPGVTRVTAGSDLVASVSVQSATSLRATFVVPASTTWGTRTLSVSNAAPGGGATTLASAVQVGQFVYPGDANHDGIVNEEDVLPLGRWFGASGAKRTSASSSWAPQSLSAPWSVFEAAFADCDGDGTVNALDVKPIVLNWKRTPGSAGTNPADASEACATLLAAIGENPQGEPQRQLRAALLDMSSDGASARFAMASPSPNPSRGEASIAFTLPSSEREARVEVYSPQGQRVWEFTKAEAAAGPHVVQWNGCDRQGRNVAPGLYLVRVVAGRHEATRRLVRIP